VLTTTIIIIIVVVTSFMHGCCTPRDLSQLRTVSQPYDLEAVAGVMLS